MIIRIDDIPEEGLSLDIDEEGAELEKLAEGLDFSILSPVRAHLDVTATGSDVFVRGSLDSRLRLVCSRCLKEFEYALKTPFYLLFSKEREGGREKELTTSDMEVNYVEGGELDTKEILLAQIALEIPIKPLCVEGCEGLCPHCGADLNDGPCGCKTEERTDPRFAKLKDFKVE